MWNLVLLIIFKFSKIYAINGKCRVLALGGGTDKGAYEAGAIIGLINRLEDEESQ